VYTRMPRASSKSNHDKVNYQTHEYERRLCIK